MGKERIYKESAPPFVHEQGVVTRWVCLPPQRAGPKVQIANTISITEIYSNVSMVEENIKRKSVPYFFHE